MSSEEWRIIPAFENYEVSSFGRIRNRRKCRILKPAKEEGGYLRVCLYNNGKMETCKVHRLVALAFIPNPANKPTVNHKDHVKANNFLENLEWATVAEQNLHKRKQAVQENYLNSARAVWKCDMVTGRRLERFGTMKIAALSVTKTKDGKSKICAVARGRIDKGGYVRVTAYGFRWEYDVQPDMGEEVWKDIPPEMLKGIMGYALSSEGRIRNRSGRIGLPFKGTAGYMWVSVHPYQFQAHVLVAKVFLPNPLNKPIVNHKDGNKQSPRLSNLEWSTHAENSQHAHDTGLSSIGKPVQQLSLNGELMAVYSNCATASRVTGVCHSDICKVAAVEGRTAGGFKWKYDDIM